MKICSFYQLTFNVFSDYYKELKLQETLAEKRAKVDCTLVYLHIL